MVEKPYQPIACSLHESFELAALRHAALDLSWHGEDGGACKARLMPEDVFTRQGAEYLTGRTLEGNLQVIRLDRIFSASWAANGEALIGASEK